MSKNLYKFYWNCGRSGEVEGLFFANKEVVQQAIGKDVYFGEILGKHSEVYGVLEEKDLDEIELPEDVCNTLIKALGESVSGYNPLNYVRYECKVCGDMIHVDEFSIKDSKCNYCLEEENEK